MGAAALTVLHTSDWQFGKPFLPAAAEAMLRLEKQVGADVAVVAGDLTQRAKRGEYRAAAALLAKLARVPVVTTPGNHDAPLYRVWERIFAPFRNWRRFVSRELDTVTRGEGSTFVALCSAAPHRAIVNGRLHAEQLAFAERAFDEAPTSDLRCLVVHHHFVPVPDGDGGPPLPEAPRWLGRIEAMGVDTVFGGHVHQTHLNTSREVLVDGTGPGVPILNCGTTLSRRGRGVERGLNSLNVVRITRSAVRVTPYLLLKGSADFVPGEPRSLPLPRSVVDRGVRMGSDRGARVGSDRA